jgi:hypothetical protein
MTQGNTTNLTNTSNQFNPSQFGQTGLPNSGYFNGIGGLPLGGYGPTNYNGDFSSLLSSLNSSGTFGPGITNNLAPANTNPQAISTLTEGASYLTTSLLNRFSGSSVPPDALYSSSVFGKNTSGFSWLDTVGMISGSLGGLIKDKNSQNILLMLPSAFGALNGISGIFKGLQVAKSTPPALPMSSPDAMEDYQDEIF